MGKFSSVIDRLFGRSSHQGQMRMPAEEVGEPSFGVTRPGRKSELRQQIDAMGARPGDTVAIDERGDASVVGRKLQVAAVSSEEDRAMHKLLRMKECGVTHFTWVHSGVELPCNGVDHSKVDGRKFKIEAFLKTGKPLPGAEKGCRCTFTAVI